MATTTRNDFTQGIRKDMYGYFFDAYDQKATVYDKLFKVEPSDAAWEQGTSVIGPGQLVEKGEGESISYRKISEGFTTYGDNHTFTDGIIITLEAQEDNKKITNIIRTAAAKWGESVKHSRETYYAKAFNKGGITAGNDFFKNPIAGQNAGGLIYDGKPLFNLVGNERTSKGGGTYYNGHALPLSQANLITVYDRAVGTNNRDERDEIISLPFDTLVVPPALAMTARVILNSTNLPGSSNNDVNVASSLLNLVVWDYLTDTDAWFIMKAGEGLVAQNRKEPVIDFYIDEDTKSYKANVVARWGFRCDNWRFVSGSQFATS